jgi:hypothetical protein
MGKGSVALGVIALVLAAGGLGLGGLAWISVSTIEQGDSLSEQNTWYKFSEPAFNCNPTGTYLTFSALTIEFELGQNESVYFSYTGRAHVESVSLDWSRVVVYFRVDGIFQSDPNAVVGMNNVGFMINFMLHLQTVKSDLSAGIHNVTVVIWGDSTANYVSQSTLIVQKVST